MTTAFYFAEIVSLTFKKDFKVEKVEVVSLAIGAVFGSVIGCFIFTFLKLDSFMNPLFGELGKTIENLNARFKAVGVAFDKKNDTIAALAKAVDDQVNHSAYCLDLQVKINQGLSAQIATIMQYLNPANVETTTTTEGLKNESGIVEPEKSDASTPNCT